jgi:hypothetical protein
VKASLEKLKPHQTDELGALEKEQELTSFAVEHRFITL